MCCHAFALCCNRSLLSEVVHIQKQHLTTSVWQIRSRQCPPLFGYRLGSGHGGGIVCGMAWGSLQHWEAMGCRRLPVRTVARLRPSVSSTGSSSTVRESPSLGSPPVPGGTTSSIPEAPCCSSGRKNIEIVGRHHTVWESRARCHWQQCGSLPKSGITTALIPPGDARLRMRLKHFSARLTWSVISGAFDRPEG